MRQNKKLVHLVQDEKWTWGAYYLFETAFPSLNEYIVIKPSTNKPLKYISYIRKLHEFSMDDFFAELSSLLNSAALIVLHGLIYNHAVIAQEILQQKQVLWLIMGADMYQNPYIYDKPILGEKTKILKNRIENRFNLKNELKYIYRNISGRKQINKTEAYRFVANVAKNIDYVATFQEEQFQLLKNLKAINSNAKHLHFTYYPLEKIVKPDENIKITDINILLGNSASYTNNHLEAIDKLAEFNLGDRKVYTPLSYGNKIYAKEIIKYGKSKLSSNFYPITQFLPFDKYNEIIQSCTAVIMNHYRGQAAGNVLSSLYRGKKIFMSENSTIFKYLKRLGCYIYSIENDLSEEKDFNSLNEGEILHNRELIKGEISEKVLFDNLKTSITKNTDIND